MCGETTQGSSHVKSAVSRAGRYFWPASVIIVLRDSGVSDSICTSLPLINMVGVCETPPLSAAALIEVTQSACARRFTQVWNASVGGDPTTLVARSINCGSLHYRVWLANNPR